MEFDSLLYGEEAARLLALAGDGLDVQDLLPGKCRYPAARVALKNSVAAKVFPGGRSPEGALAGLYLYIGCLDEGHAIAQDLLSKEGSLWHGIMHRLEGDFSNAKYWFSRAGAHAVYPKLAMAAREVGYDAGETWDPLEFVDFCETSGRRKGSEEEAVAKAVQTLEWRYLFDWCARGSHGKVKA